MFRLLLLGPRPAATVSWPLSALRAEPRVPPIPIFLRGERGADHDGGPEARQEPNEQLPRVRHAARWLRERERAKISGEGLSTQELVECYTAKFENIFDDPPPPPFSPLSRRL